MLIGALALVLASGAHRRRQPGRRCAGSASGCRSTTSAPGQASLAYLKQLPLDEVKIDRAFVTSMADDDGDAVIVHSTIDLARNLGPDVVAEGVESESVLEALVDLRCSSAQGFYLGRPLPSAELELWLSNRSSAPRTSAAITR